LSALCARLCGAALWELVAATGFGTFSSFRQIGFVAVRIVSSLQCGGEAASSGLLEGDKRSFTLLRHAEAVFRRN
jgi:hypothetical protein